MRLGGLLPCPLARVSFLYPSWPNEAGQLWSLTSGTVPPKSWLKSIFSGGFW